MDSRALVSRIRRKFQARLLISTCHGDRFDQSSSLCSPSLRAMLAAEPINALAWTDFLHSKRKTCNARHINNDILANLLILAEINIKDVLYAVETPGGSGGYVFVGSSTSSVRIQWRSGTCSVARSLFLSENVLLCIRGSCSLWRGYI